MSDTPTTPPGGQSPEPWNRRAFLLASGGVAIAAGTAGRAVAEARPARATAPRAPFRTDVTGGMAIDWDVKIVADDGNALSADVFRPTKPGRYPVLLACGPYGKGRPFQQMMPAAYQQLVAQHPDVGQGTSQKFQVYEFADPEKWVPDGYVCVRVDARGTGRSPGLLDILSPRETQDLYESIEWAARQPWSNGRVGLLGISYLAINQWQVAAERPPHLSAICTWEGAIDWYREASHHGGILSTFMDGWYGGIVSSTQYGLGEKGGRNPNSGQLICGDETFTAAELAERRVDLSRIIREHPYDDRYYRDRVADLSRIDVPLLSAGNWGGLGLHLRGNTRGFELAGSAEKWLTMHNEGHWSLFYAQYGLDLQKRFFGHFLKDEDNDWKRQPRVEMLTRHVDGSTGKRTATAWPLPETRWTRLYLDAEARALQPRPARSSARVSYTGKEGGASFSFVCPADLELAGPVAAKLYVESSTADTDLFLAVRAFAPDGTEIVFNGANDPHVPVSQGWLRASQRALDPHLSRPFLPVHPHDRSRYLKPGKVYETDIEIWPTSLRLPAGYTLTLSVQAHDYVWPGAGHGGLNTGSGPFLHDDPEDRPDAVYGGTVTLHTGPKHASYLLLPVLPD